MKMQISMFFLLFLSSMTMVACQDKGAIENVNIDDAKLLIDEGKIEIIDVRTLEEYESGHIPGAKLLPLQELESRIDELEKDQSYLLVCRSGNRSSQAAQILSKNGFTAIYNMNKGMSAWTYDVE